MIRTLLTLGLLTGIAVGGTAFYKNYFRSDSGKDLFRVEKVIRGDLQINVRATGTVEPEEAVDVARKSWVESRNSEKTRAA